MGGPEFSQQGSLLVQVRRGPYIESTHEISVCVATAGGEALYSRGDIDRVFPIRSLAKPFIVNEVIRSGAADAYDIGEVELALAAGSHDGEERHTTAVRVFLSKLGLTQEDLLCGPALEGKVVVGPPAANNCSGKHAAVLALCSHMSLAPHGYTDAKHPVHQRLLPALFEAFGRTTEDTPLVIDGCSMPIFGASLRQIAIAYARFGVAKDSASARLRAAMTAEAEYVGGWFANLDTQIISWSAGTIIGKIGAEGLHADTIVGRGVGIAIKVHDGNSRALPPILARLFVDFTEPRLMSKKHLTQLADAAVLNAAGVRVGEVRAVGFPILHNGATR